MSTSACESSSYQRSSSAAPSTIPTDVAATSCFNGDTFSVPAATSAFRARASATAAPVMAAVRVPPSAWITSQSRITVRSPRACMSTTERRLRPISRWISWVRPPILPRSLSRGVRVTVDRGSMAYSAVTQPRPELRSQPGTPGSMVALVSTRVFPRETNTDLPRSERNWGSARGAVSGGTRPPGRKNSWGIGNCTLGRRTTPR